MSLVHIFPVRSLTTDGKLAHDLALSKVPDLSVDQIAKALQIEAALSARPHEKVAPDAGSSHRVLDAQLHRSVKSDHLLHKMIRAGVYSIRPGDANREPPPQRLKTKWSIKGNAKGLSEALTRPSGKHLSGYVS